MKFAYRYFVYFVIGAKPMRSKWRHILLIGLVIPVLADAARAQILVDGTPGNHVEKQGTTIDRGAKRDILLCCFPVAPDASWATR